MRHVMLICGNDSAWNEQDEALMSEVHAWFDKWHAAGKILPGSAELDSVRTAKTVSRGGDGQPVVTDGPYLELKEVVGGFVHLAADDIDDAVAVAATWPGIAACGDKVEVRPIVER